MAEQVRAAPPRVALGSASALDAALDGGLPTVVDRRPLPADELQP